MSLEPNIKRCGWTLFKLYISPQNIDYVKQQILHALKCERLQRLCDCDVVPKVTYEDLGFIDEYMESQDIRETDPQLLSTYNARIILSTAGQILREPDLFNPQLPREEGISDYSFRGGTWHPEDLFIQKQRNWENNYWEELDVRFDPLAAGVGNHWKYDALRDGREQNNYFFGRDAPSKRHIAPLDEGLRISGDEDRRVQIPKVFKFENGQI